MSEKPFVIFNECLFGLNKKKYWFQLTESILFSFYFFIFHKIEFGHSSYPFPAESIARWNSDSLRKIKYLINDNFKQNSCTYQLIDELCAAKKNHKLSNIYASTWSWFQLSWIRLFGKNKRKCVLFYAKFTVCFINEKWN